jgi:acetyltransferase-like isoleucine patch superfamily enzyme
MRGAILFFLRASAALSARLRTFAYGRIASLDPTARVMATGLVLNPRADPALVRIGAHSVVRGELFVFAHAGSIDIGDWCFVGENSRIWSASAVSIGRRVLISHDVNIQDTNGHPVDDQARHLHFQQIMSAGHPPTVDMQSKPISIGDDAWIGFGATILKGVSIGAGAIVAARSVVLADVPSRCLVAGNPARLVRMLDS